MEKQEIRTFGRRHGKRLSARQQWLVDNLLPKLSPCESQIAHYDSLILEIGFGSGEHLLELAAANPDSIVIGAEPFINGVASLLSAMTMNDEQCATSNYLDLIKPEYRNIRIWPDDVRKLFSSHESRITNHGMQDANFCFAKVCILHPDPWPKARHEKRRLLSADFLNLLADYLAPGGQIIIGTDHHEYYDWIAGQAAKTGLLIADHEPRIIETRYQRKNKAGTDAPKYLVLTNQKEQLS
jgi:tRNA (guanine-N7-)-methyltransferase